MVKLSTRRGRSCSKLDETCAVGRYSGLSVPLRLPRKNNANGPGAGVAADGGADVGLDDLLEVAVLFQARFHGLHAAGLGLAGGDEHQAAVDVVAAVELVGDVFAHADGQAAAVLFNDFDLAIDDAEAGLDAQDVGAKGQYARAAAALGHVVQLVEHEAQLDALREVLQPHTDVLGVEAVGGPLGRAEDEIALPGADVLAVHDEDVLELLGGEAGVLVAGRKLAADGNVDDGVVLLGEGLEEIGIFHKVCGGGFGQFAAVLDVGKHVGGADGDAVQIAFLAHEDVHGHERKVPLLQKSRAQVAGAVGGDLDVQRGSPLFWPGSAAAKSKMFPFTIAQMLQES